MQERSVLVLVWALPALLCCGGKASTELQPVIVGATAPLTGAQQSIGRGVQDMLRLAEAEINSRGGVLGRPFTLDVRDDASDVTVATGLANEFAQDAKVVAVVGFSTSAQALAAERILYDASKPIISALALSPELSTRQPQRERFFFRTEASAVLQARAAALWLRSTPPRCSRLAIFSYGDLSGVGAPVADELAKRFKERGGEVVLRVNVEPNATTYEPEVQQLIASTAECQAVLMLSKPGALFLRGFRKLTANDSSRDWSKFTTVGTISFYSAGFVAEGRVDPTNPALVSAAEGIHGMAIDLTPATPEYSELLNLYTSAHGSLQAGQPAPPASVYDAVMLLALAIRKADSTDGSAIRDALFDVARGGTSFGPLDYSEAVVALSRGVDVDYHGASGNCDFDDWGDVLQDHLVWRVEGGQFRTLEPISAKDL